MAASTPLSLSHRLPSSSVALAVCLCSCLAHCLLDCPVCTAYCRLTAVVTTGGAVHAMFGNTSTDDFEDEDALDPGYKPPQSFDTPQALPTVTQPAHPNNYPFAAPPQITWQQPTAAPVATSAVAQPFAQPVGQAASAQSQSVSGPGRRIPAAWGGTAPTPAPASTALPSKPIAAPVKPTPFIPVATAYTPTSVPSSTSALPTMHVSHPVRDGSVALPSPVTSAVNTSTYKGPSAFSNGESYFDDED